MSFVVDIITEKLGDSFSIFSKDALKKFEQAADLAKKKITNADTLFGAINTDLEELGPNWTKYVFN